MFILVLKDWEELLLFLRIVFARVFLCGFGSLGLLLFFNICLYKIIECMFQCRCFGKPGNIRRGLWVNE